MATLDKSIEYFWDVCHKAEDISSLTGSTYEDFIEGLRVSNSLESFSTVLEVGIGFGKVTEALHEAGFKVSALDVSKEGLKRVDKFCERVYTLNQLSELPTDYFDYILCANVIQHVPTPTLTEELKHLLRSLKKGTGLMALQFVSDGVTEDTGATPSIATVKAGLCCRTPFFLQKLIRSFEGSCDLVVEDEVEAGAIKKSCVFHIRRVF